MTKNQSIFNIIRWVDGPNDSSTKHLILMFQVLFFFQNFLQNSLQKLFQFIFLFLIITKIKIKSFECPKSIRNYEKKNNAWNIRRLVDESFILKIVGFQKTYESKDARVVSSLTASPTLVLLR